MEDHIKASFRWSQEELLIAQRAQFRYSPELKKVRGLYLFAIIFLPIVGAYFLLKGGSSIMGLWFLAVTVGLFIAPFKLRSMVIKQYSQRPDRDMLVNYEFSHEHILNKTEASSSTLEWRMITKVLETPKGFLLYPNSQMFHWLPMHAFSDTATVEEFIKLLKSKVQQFTRVS